jgi:hypothetical protein
MTGAETDRPSDDLRRVQVDVVSISKPELGSEPDTYRCDAEVRISEGTDRRVEKARLAIQHPSGWMGVTAGFSYELDARVYPTFEARAEQACLWALEEFPSDEIISVFLLGSGTIDYDG